MEDALRHAFDPDSPYLVPLVKIFAKLPSEDIARCRALSRSARRLLCNDEFLSCFPIYFSGFIFTPSPTSEFIHYFSIPSRRTFTNIHRYVEDIRIISSHDNLLLVTGTGDGRPWRLVNPLTGVAITPPCVFYSHDNIISAAICSRTGSGYRVFFLVSSSQYGTCKVTISKTTTASGPNFRYSRCQLYSDPLSSIINLGSGSEIRPCVHARFPSHCFVCILFPVSKQVLVVSCRSPGKWVFHLSQGWAAGAGGEYGLCRTAESKVHLTWVRGEYLALWKLELNVVNGSVDVEPSFEFLRRLRIVYFSHFPGLRVEHFEREYVYLRYGPYGKYIWRYNMEVEMGRSLIELPLSKGEETGSEDGKWPPVFAYSCYLGDREDRWED